MACRHATRAVGFIALFFSDFATSAITFHHQFGNVGTKSGINSSTLWGDALHPSSTTPAHGETDQGNGSREDVRVRAELSKLKENLCEANKSRGACGVHDCIRILYSGSE